jgi:hypothetical protein
LWELATELCRRHGYLCFENVSPADAAPIVALELSIYETVQLLIEAVGDPDVVADCLSSHECLEAFIASSREAAEWALRGVYKYGVSVDEAVRAIRVLEKISGRGG